MDQQVEQCVEAIRGLIPDEADTLPEATLRNLAEQIYRSDPALADQVKAKSGTFSPRAPTYLFVHEIVTYCCVVYSAYEVIGKIDNITTIALDHNKQLEIVNRAIAKLRLIGLESPADKVAALRDSVLDYLTKPKG